MVLIAPTVNDDHVYSKKSEERQTRSGYRHDYARQRTVAALLFYYRHRGKQLTEQPDFQENPRLPKQSWVFCFLRKAGPPKTTKTKAKQNIERTIMSATLLRLPTAFGPDIRFEFPPLVEAPFRATEESELELLKRRLLLNRLRAEADPALNALYRRSANKAASLAELTGYPLLVFPSLFEELASKTIRAFGRARRVRTQSHPMMLVEAA